ncbi:tetratricopeptide repeat protein [Fulvivirga maritima]|uniref:tetratricopeptide repeat protein n=1 Tax=Fulvivirga maritima TaxID=2904247 RepID=UPI001F442149|nr:tetratricopeptide repeat protein [Fulvivirga maritima]UII28308.1 tetratricopeptide repeat protein [Fulvivirga maritima]
MVEEFIEILEAVKESYLVCDVIHTQVELNKAARLLPEIEDEEQLTAYHKLSMKILSWLYPADEQNAASVLSHLDALEGLNQADEADYVYATTYYAWCDIDIFEKGLKLFPKSIGLKKNLANYFEHQGEYEKAQACLTEVMDQTPYDLDALMDSQIFYQRETETLAGKDHSDINESNIKRLVEVTGKSYQIHLQQALLTSDVAASILIDNEVSSHLSLNYARQGEWQQAGETWHALSTEEALDNDSLLAFAELNNMSSRYEGTLALLENYEAPSTQDSFNSLEDAIKHWESKTPTSRQYSRALYLKGVALKAEGKAEQAIALYDQALEIMPTNTQATLGKARAYYALQNYEDSFNLINKAYELGLSNTAYYNEYAEIYFGLRDTQRLYQILNRLHQTEMVRARTAYLMGVALYGGGQFKNAVEWLTKCIENFGSHHDMANAIYYRALAYRAEFNFTEAIKDTQALFQFYPQGSPNYWHAMLLMGDMAYQLNANDKAYDYFVAVNAHQPLEGIYKLYMQLLIHDGYNEGSEYGTPENIGDLSLESLIHEPKDAIDYLVNAKVFSIFDMPKEAVEACIKVAELGFKPDVYYYSAFNTAYAAKQYAIVVNLYHKILELVPTAFNDVLSAKWAFSLYKLERYEETVKAYQEILYNFPSISDDLDSTIKWAKVIAESHYHLGHYNEAVKYLGIVCSRKKQLSYQDLFDFEKYLTCSDDYDPFTQYSLLKTLEEDGAELSEEQQAKLKKIEIKLLNELVHGDF